MIQGFDKFDGYVFQKGDLDEKAFLALSKKVKKALNKEAELRDIFLDTLKEHGKTAARKPARQYFNSLSARVAGVLQMHNDLRLAERLSLQECWALSQVIALHKPTDEKVRVRFKQKSSGGKRPICAFGPNHKTAQKMVRRLLKPCVAPRAWQFGLKGVPAAISYIKSKAYGNEAWACTLDIQNFYGSFVDEDVRTLLNFLPSKVVDNTVITNGMLLTDMAGSPLCGQPLLDARPGVPQGSAASPLVGELAVSKLKLKLPPGVCFANYADDFLVIVPTEDQLEAALLAFASAVAELPGGTFKLKQKQCSPIADGVIFLSHHLQMENSHWVATPSDDAYSNLWYDLEKLEATAIAAKKRYLKQKSHGNRMAALSAIDRCRAHGVGWLAAFSECEDVVLKAIKDDTEGRVAGLLKGTDIAFDELLGPQPLFENFVGGKRRGRSSGGY